MTLKCYDRGEIAPDQVTHKLDLGWSTFDFGDRRIEVRVTDLPAIREARQLAQMVAAQAAMWDTDLAALEDGLAAADAPEPLPDLGPEPDAPFGGDDPKLDAAVERVAELADAQRDPEEEGDL